MRRLVALLLLVTASCGGDGLLGPSRRTRRYEKAQLQASLKQIETPGVVIGTFTVARQAVVDGDTFKVDGLDTSLRLLGIDTEEKFWNEKEKRALEGAGSWANYTRQMRGSSGRPVKMASPMGEEASKWAKQWFADVNEVRLERDHPKEIRDRYDRYLAYVFAQKGGVWLNYNVEIVRAGYSPYFMKYGYSARFHADFVKAQDEARAAGRGIWDPTRDHYPDYDERLAWWIARAEFVRAYYSEAAGRPEYIVLTEWDALRRLEQHEGKEVVLLGTVSDVVLGDRGPHRVMLGRRIGSDFALIFFDKDLFGSLELTRQKSEFLVVRGTVTRYHNKYKKRDELQIVVGMPSQIAVAELPPLRPPQEEARSR